MTTAEFLLNRFTEKEIITFFDVHSESTGEDIMRMANKVELLALDSGAKLSDTRYFFEDLRDELAMVKPQAAQLKDFMKTRCDGKVEQAAKQLCVTAPTIYDALKYNNAVVISGEIYISRNIKAKAKKGVVQ